MVPGMRALVQRVTEVAVTVDGREIGRIGPGLLILLGVRTTDTPAETAWLADKCLNLRIFEDADGKFNHSLAEVGGEALVVSQFTLYGDASRGRRPGFTDAARPELAIPLYEAFIGLLRAASVRTATGEFGAKMDVRLVNHGPVTLLVEREAGATGE
jgi:D-tyrosyl-tRNA(Tyr) deacylase